MSKGLNIALWIVAGLLTVAFVPGGVMNLIKPETAAGYVHFGLPEWFRFLIGGSEVAGGIGLLLRPVRFLAAVGLIIIMIGAFACHMKMGEGLMAIPSVVMLLLLAFVAWGRRPGRAQP